MSGAIGGVLISVLRNLLIMLIVQCLYAVNHTIDSVRNTNDTYLFYYSVHLNEFQLWIINGTSNLNLLFPVFFTAFNVAVT